MSEIWQLYSKDRIKLNKTIVRGQPMPQNEYHLVVNVWIITKNNRIILSQRSGNKTWPLAFECTGGSAIDNETTIEAAVREVKEELNIDIKPQDLHLIHSTPFKVYQEVIENNNQIVDTFVYKANSKLSNIKPQENEVEKYIFVTWKDLIKIWQDGKIALPITLRFKEYQNKLKEFLFN